VRIVYRHRAQHEAVDGAEHSGIGADADRQRKHHQQREAGAFLQHSKAVSQVAQEHRNVLRIRNEDA